MGDDIYFDAPTEHNAEGEGENPIRLPPVPGDEGEVRFIKKAGKRKPKTTSAKRTLDTSRKHGGTITLAQLKKYKAYLNAIANARSPADMQELLQHMRSADFKIMCTCMHDLLHDRGVMHNYFTEAEAKKLKTLIKPWTKNLKVMTDPKVKIHTKKKLLTQRQRGGSAILASVIGALIPMAVNAISKWVSGGKKK